DDRCREAALRPLAVALHEQEHVVVLDQAVDARAGRIVHRESSESAVGEASGARRTGSSQAGIACSSRWGSERWMPASVLRTGAAERARAAAARAHALARLAAVALAERLGEDRAAEPLERAPAADLVGGAREPVAAAGAAHALPEPAEPQLAHQLRGVFGREAL